MRYGNPAYVAENTVSGIFFMFIAAIQFMEFLIWIDLDGARGLNALATAVGPYLNVGQPTILYIIKMLYFAPSWRPMTFVVAALNALYALHVASVKTSTLTRVSRGHLSWTWLNSASPTAYLVMFALNIFYLTDFYYSLVLFAIIYLALYVSAQYFEYHVGEMWCFFGAFIPAVMFALSYAI